MSRAIENPLALPGFTFIPDKPTRQCSTLLKDSPAIFLDPKTHGKHKLKSGGGYQCTAGPLCTAVYCYHCAVNHFGQSGRQGIVDYHAAKCAERVGTVKQSLKRPLATLTPPRSPTPPERKLKMKHSESSPVKTSDYAPSEPPSSTPEVTAPTLRKSARRKSGPHLREAYGVEAIGPISPPIRKGRSKRKSSPSGDEGDEDVRIIDPLVVTRKKVQPKASINRHPKPPVPPPGPVEFRDLPGAAWPATNTLDRYSELKRSRKPSIFTPTGEDHRMLTSKDDFFTHVPNGTGSWFFPDEIRRERSGKADKDMSSTGGTDKYSSPAFKREKAEMRKLAAQSDDENPSDLSARSATNPYRRFNNEDIDQMSISDRDRSDPRHGKSELEHQYKDYVPVHPSIANRARALRHVSEAVIASGPHNNNVPSAKPGSTQTHYSELHRHLDVCGPSAREKAKQRMAANAADKLKGDEEILWTLKRNHDRYVTAHYLKGAIEEVEDHMKWCQDVRARPRYDEYIEELRQRLAGAEERGTTVHAEGQDDGPLRRVSTPVSPRTRRS